jgi:hypothetical protein
MLGRRSAAKVSLLMERDFWVCALSYKHLAPLERKLIRLLLLPVEFTKEKVMSYEWAPW